MEKSSFFNSVSHDRRYAAEDWAAYFASFISNGVFAKPSSNLQVMISTGMKIAIKTGIAFINGYRYQNTADLIKTIAVADGIYNRIDRVVVRWSLVDRSIKVEILQGTPSETPTAPALTRNVEVYELALADITIGAGVSSISQSAIKDTRADTSICGWVTSVIDQVDTDTLFNQWQTAYEEEYIKTQNYLAEQRAAWEAFFGGITEDNIIPAPALDDAGKVPIVNASATSYELKTILDAFGPKSITAIYMGDMAITTEKLANGSVTTEKLTQEVKDLINGKAPAYTYGTGDLTAGSSALATGTLHLVYE